MKRTRMISAAAIVALLGSVSAGFAEGDQSKTGDHGHRGGPAMFNFSVVDADNDGKVTQAELQAHSAARFTQMDTDTSETVSVEEMTAHREEIKAQRADGEKVRQHAGEKDGKGQRRGGVERMFEHLDADKDGELSLSEMTRRQTGMFEKLDANGDGALTEAELKAGAPKRDLK